MRKRKKSLILGIILLVLVLGIGYAYLTTTLSINGITDVDSNTWNIYWDNVQVTTGSVTGAQVTTAPTIDTNKTTVSFHVRLKEPGEYYEFTVDAKNDGSIDAMIETITKTTSIPNYLRYTVTYEDETPIVENHLLAANSTEKYLIRVEYRTDINPGDLPTNAASIDLSFGVNYIQSDNNAVVVNHKFTGTKYMAADETINIGDSIIEKNLYDTAASAMSQSTEYWVHANDIPFCFNLTVVKDIVTDAELELIVTPEMVNTYPSMTAGTYYLKNRSDKYSENVATLRTAFGSSMCTESTDTYSEYFCRVGELEAKTTNEATGINFIGIYYTCACELGNNRDNFYCWHE